MNTTSLPNEKLADLLNKAADQYNNPSFIATDPISIPHRFESKPNREIMGFFAAILAWGQRPTIIAKCKELAQRMDNAPADFVMHHQPSDLKALEGFKHRTFNDTDLLHCIAVMNHHYASHDSLEDMFLEDDGSFVSVKSSLTHFHQRFFSSEYAPQRTRKHFATPQRQSACKRLNMFLRWMVRRDNKGVDFGLWHRIPQSELICPIDLHVERTARALNLISRPKPDWLMAEELTCSLRQFDRTDPVKYDFALFGLSVNQML